MNSSLDKYKVDHLFLLMGENPLPNCVAAMTMVRDGGNVYLVHTRHTQNQADRLGAFLNQEIPHINNAQLLSIGDNQAEGYHIRAKIQAIASGLCGSLGMNYTGGTKVMAVHAYRALFEIEPHAVFSYLDPHSLEMCIDNDYGESIRLRISPQLSLEQIFKLHGLFWRTDRPPTSNPLLPQAAAALAKLHSNSSLAKAWRDWCHTQLRPAARKDTYQWHEDTELLRMPALSLTGLPADFKLILQQYLGATNDKLSIQTARKEGFNQLRNVCEWLDGIWLENYVLQQIKLIAASYSIHDSKMSFHIQDGGKAFSKWDKFEFDVAFMRDYHLFALSCTTTDQRNLCKQKLIEANLRSRQLGGGEARVALVCCYDKAANLKSELEVETRNRKIAVFGRQDLPSLAPKIAQWIQQNA